MTTTDIFAELGALFEGDLWLVGGSVRDRLLGREPKDLDFTTSLWPDAIHLLLLDWADAVWDIGREFGTIAACKDGIDVEITTFRTDGAGRKPEVQFNATLHEDLKRRDFTINAMAIPVTVDMFGLTNTMVDPFGGLSDLSSNIIDTPRDPALSFGDDPLRILRAARFVSQLDFEVADRVWIAMEQLAPRLAEISAERIAAEMDKLLMGTNPEAALLVLTETGAMDFILPELDNLAFALLGDDVETRWADLLRHTAPADVERRLRALRFSGERVRNVVHLVVDANRFFGVEWTDAMVRRALADAGTGEQFVRLCKLLSASDTLLPRARALLAAEGWPSPLLTGDQVMEALGIPPGKKVGQAMSFLWQLRLDEGPGVDAKARLKEWVS